jgi:hypothetical protein
MGDSHEKQIKRGTPVWAWDGHWWPATVDDLRRSSGTLIVRLENAVTVPVERAQIQIRDPALHGADKPRRHPRSS